MKYSTIKLLEIINALIIILFFAVVFTLRLPVRSSNWMILSIAMFVIFVIPLFILEHINNRNYSHWDRLWKLPPAVIAAFILLVVIMLVGALLTEHGVAWMVVILAFLRLAPDYYYARKYDMDELHSVDELLQKHPEAKSKMRKGVL